ncbi:histidinol-phosphate transaminase [Elusimicrobiota bacterium]
MEKFDVCRLVRKNCLAFEPYVAGKPIETLKRELGLKHIIKIASNENPLGPSKKAVQAMKNVVEKVYFYPDFNSTDLKTTIANKFKLSTKNILVGAGSDELIEIIGKLFFTSSDEIVISKHAFIRYKMAVQLMASKSVVVAMKDGLTHDLNAMLKACNKNTKAVFIANPNNPTGTYVTAKEIEVFLQKLPKNKYGMKPLVIIDEAYYEYASFKKDYPQTLKYLSKNPNLIILRTFSKIYALAGARVGYGFASEQVADYIERIRPPFNLNIFAQTAGVASLKDDNQVKRSLAHIRKEMKFVTDGFKKLKIDFIESVGNFVLFSVSPLNGSDVFKQLLREGVIVRAMGEYDLHNYVRVTIGTRAENQLFLNKLKKVLGK